MLSQFPRIYYNNQFERAHKAHAAGAKTRGAWKGSN